MELVNKRITYSLSEDSDTLRANGEVLISNDSQISSLNCTICNLNGEFLGNMNYMEYNTGKISLSIQDIDSDIMEKAFTLLGNVVTGVKAEIFK